MKNLLYTNIDLSNYTYPLPEKQIAKFPLVKRDDAKLLVFKDGQIYNTKFNEITDYIPPNSLLVFNNSRVVHSRLFFKKQSGANIEIFCHSPIHPSEYEKNFNANKECVWLCMVKNAKKWKNEVLKTTFIVNKMEVTLYAEKLEMQKKDFIIKFSWSQNIPFSSILENKGKIPIPPYLKREAEAVDYEKYQTTFAKKNGSVAAPTAGLHFTPSLFKKIKSTQLKSIELTLHVGAGTFQPIVSKSILNHGMHKEYFNFTLENLKNLYENFGSILAIGTTSVRSLESIYHIGRKLIQKMDNPFEISQWEIYNEQNISTESALQELIEYMLRNNLKNCKASTKILILPGYKFKMINSMLTNFHLPYSTLLLLVAAWLGKDWKNVYQTALDNNFRFLSYGDTSLLFN